MKHRDTDPTQQSATTIDEVAIVAGLGAAVLTHKQQEMLRRYTERPESLVHVRTQQVSGPERSWK